MQDITIQNQYSNSLEILRAIFELIHGFPIIYHCKQTKEEWYILAFDSHAQTLLTRMIQKYEDDSFLILSSNRFEALNKLAVSQDNKMLQISARQLKGFTIDELNIFVGNNHDKNNVVNSITPNIASKELNLLRIIAQKAELLPAFWIVNKNAVHQGIFNQRLHYLTSSILSSSTYSMLVEVCSTGIVLKTNNNNKIQAEIKVFRYEYKEHYAIIVRDKEKNIPYNPLIRIHSSCFTGDLLRSIRCDCYPQLHLAIDNIASHGGVIIYLNQEGRGIGLTNKLRTYYLQQEMDLDTVDANLHLGLDDDNRDFIVAAEILSALQITKLRLLSNNPAKTEMLRKKGLNVESVPHVASADKYLQKYYTAKINKLDHQNLPNN